MQNSRISSTMVAIPDCLLQSCCSGVVLPTRSTLALPCLRNYLAIVNFQHLVADTAECLKAFHPTISRSNAQAFRRVQEEDGSNVDNPFAHVTFALPKSFGFQLEAVAHTIVRDLSGL